MYGPLGPIPPLGRSQDGCADLLDRWRYRLLTWRALVSSVSCSATPKLCCPFYAGYKADAVFET